MFERLESRRLFAVSLTLDNAGVLRITGSAEDENLFVSESIHADDPGAGRQFDIVQQINGVGYDLGSVPESMVTRVVLDGPGGNDFLSCDTSGSVGADILGGGGNDQIQFRDE